MHPKVNDKQPLRNVGEAQDWLQQFDRSLPIGSNCQYGDESSFPLMGSVEAGDEVGLKDCKDDGGTPPWHFLPHLMLEGYERYAEDPEIDMVESPTLKNSDVCTHINNEFDRDILTRPLFDVNMRLFQTSPHYRHIVLDCCQYIRHCSSTTREGYKKPHGFSGANGGVPFNIIAYNHKDGCTVMINPKITAHSKNLYESDSNCGSLTLAEPIKVLRYGWIDVSYFDEQGQNQKLEHVTRGQGGYTIQHEVDHNLGILITDATRIST